MRRPFSSKKLVEMFVRMVRCGWRPDQYTFLFVLKVCGEIRGSAIAITENWWGSVFRGDG